MHVNCGTKIIKENWNKKFLKKIELILYFLQINIDIVILHNKYSLCNIYHKKLLKVDL